MLHFTYCVVSQLSASCAMSETCILDPPRRSCDPGPRQNLITVLGADVLLFLGFKLNLYLLAVASIVFKAVEFGFSSWRTTLKASVTFPLPCQENLTAIRSNTMYFVPDDVWSISSVWIFLSLGLPRADSILSISSSRHFRVGYPYQIGSCQSPAWIISHKFRLAYSAGVHKKQQMTGPVSASWGHLPTVSLRLRSNNHSKAFVR